MNRPTLSFDDAEDAEEPEAAQILELTDEQVVEGKRSAVDGAMAVDGDGLGDALVAEGMGTRPGSAGLNEWGS